ncbi:MAG: hypothetical protein U5K76_02815 [Woeseiaceae bacterium]|nr:hypothetical protein [Woeseiaceae bacterium]
MIGKQCASLEWRAVSPTVKADDPDKLSVADQAVQQMPRATAEIQNPACADGPNALEHVVQPGFVQRGRLLHHRRSRYRIGVHYRESLGWWRAMVTPGFVDL